MLRDKFLSTDKGNSGSSIFCSASSGIVKLFHISSAIMAMKADPEVKFWSLEQSYRILVIVHLKKQIEYELYKKLPKKEFFKMVRVA